MCVCTHALSHTDLHTYSHTIDHTHTHTHRNTHTHTHTKKDFTSTRATPCTRKKTQNKMTQKKHTKNKPRSKRAKLCTKGQSCPLKITQEVCSRLWSRVYWSGRRRSRVSLRACILRLLLCFLPVREKGGGYHCNALQRTATRCNILQHTAARCKTLQNTAYDMGSTQACVRFNLIYLLIRFALDSFFFFFNQTHLLRRISLYSDLLRLAAAVSLSFSLILSRLPFSHFLALARACSLSRAHSFYLSLSLCLALSLSPSLSHAHTLTHTHTHIHKRTHSHTHMHAHALALSVRYIHIDIDPPHTRTRTHTHTLPFSFSHTHRYKAFNTDGL